MNPERSGQPGQERGGSEPSQAVPPVWVATDAVSFSAVSAAAAATSATTATTAVSGSSGSSATAATSATDVAGVVGHGTHSALDSAGCSSSAAITRHGDSGAGMN